MLSLFVIGRTVPITAANFAPWQDNAAQMLAVLRAILRVPCATLRAVESTTKFIAVTVYRGSLELRLASGRIVPSPL